MPPLSIYINPLKCVHLNLISNKHNLSAVTTMDSQSLLQPLNMAVPFTLSFLFLLTLLFRRLRSKLPFPPGPKGLPFIGNMLMMEQLTHRGLANLAARYGGIFYMRMGFVNMFVVSNPDIARQVLQVT